MEELRKLIEKHLPHIIVLENHLRSRYHKRKRIAELLSLMEEHAREGGLGVVKYSREEVREALGLPENGNKDEVAAKVAGRLRMLRRQVPRKKEVWDAERYGMSIFTAAGLGLTHLSRALSGSR